MPPTATQLFAAAMGRPVAPGPHRCAACGGACDATHAVSDLIDDWAGWARAADPASPWVCGGCVLSAKSADRADWPRLYSWVVRPHAAARYATGKAPLPPQVKAEGEAAQRAYRAVSLTAVRRLCLSPPPPPYAIVLTPDNTKHYLYCAAVGLDPAVATVNLGYRRLHYRPAELARLLGLTQRIAAAAGRPAVREEWDPVRLGIALSQYWRDWERLLEEWTRVRPRPPTRLAAFLCPEREVCRNEHPNDIDPAPAAFAVAGQD